MNVWKSLLHLLSNWNLVNLDVSYVWWKLWLLSRYMTHLPTHTHTHTRRKINCTPAYTHFKNLCETLWDGDGGRGSDGDGRVNCCCCFIQLKIHSNGMRRLICHRENGMAKIKLRIPEILYTHYESSTSIICTFVFIAIRLTTTYRLDAIYTHTRTLHMADQSVTVRRKAIFSFSDWFPSHVTYHRVDFSMCEPCFRCEKGWWWNCGEKLRKENVKWNCEGKLRRENVKWNCGEK